jgi:hypothetical protein
MEKYQAASLRMDKNKIQTLVLFLDDMVHIKYEITDAGETKISMQFIKFHLLHVTAQ